MVEVESVDVVEPSDRPAIVSTVLAEAIGIGAT
jgi:hypothetical protein